MTKKDYELIAKVLQSYYLAKIQSKVQDDIEFLLNEFAYHFESDNPNFNETKFREAVLKTNQQTYERKSLQNRRD